MVLELILSAQIRVEFRYVLEEKNSWKSSLSTLPSSEDSVDFIGYRVYLHKGGRWGTGPERDQAFLDQLL